MKLLNKKKLLNRWNSGKKLYLADAKYGWKDGEITTKGPFFANVPHDESWSKEGWEK